MGILDTPFEKEDDESAAEEITTSLEMLAYAISDVGLWSWYSADFPTFVQLEFVQTMLYFDKGTEEEAPSNQIAIQFGEIESVFALADVEAQVPDNWLELFTNDQVPPFHIDHEKFSFTPSLFPSLKSKQHTLTCIFGNPDHPLDASTHQFNLGFRAEEVGLIVVANKMKILTHHGEIALEDIPELHKNWWEYWEQYWAHKDTEKEFPYDALCEITIPADNENIEKIKQQLLN